MQVDPVASMQCWAVDIELAGRVYPIPALPAADWWPVITSGNPVMVLDLIEEDPEKSFNLDDLLLSGEVDGEELNAAVLDAIEAVAGRSFHVAFVLATVASMHWASVNGPLARRGFRWDVQPLGAALDALYVTILEMLPDKAHQEKFLAVLGNTALTRGKRTDRDREEVLGEFEQIAGPRPTAGARSSGAPSDSARPRTRIRPRPPRQDGRSREPRPQPGPPGRSDPLASSVPLPGAEPPTSS
jgi:hypothetical protein